MINKYYSVFFRAISNYLGILLLIIFILNSCIGKVKDNRPNFLFIIADDQSPYDLKIYNPASELNTPNIDRLATKGMVFDASYHMGSWAGGVCTPSRHMIMSGRTLWHIPDKPKFGRNPLEKDLEMVPPNLAENSMAAIFNNAGYATMRTCKKGNSYEAANAKFTIRKDKTNREGNDENGSAWHARQVLSYLNYRDSIGDNKPFLIYYGFSHPHDPRNGNEDLLDKYGAVNHKNKKTLPAHNMMQPNLPANYLPSHPFSHGHPGLRDEERVQGVWENRDDATIRNEMGREFACSENIDIQIGRVLKKLEEMGELDNTYIFYTADHGIAIGKHGLQGKQNLYEHTWRVPLIVKGPGVKKGRVQGNIYLLDVLGTLCDLAGIKPPKTVESISFRPVLEGKQETVRDVLYGVYCGGTKPGMRSVRKGDWKLIKYDVLYGTIHKTQLFNLAENPDELLKEHHDPAVIKLTRNKPKPNQVNLADDPKYAEKLAEMEALLLSEMKRYNDPYRLWSQPALKKTVKYEPTWESLKKAEVPKWFDDSKFGIMIHWGAYSVFGAVPEDSRGNYSEHVASNMYRPLRGTYPPLLKKKFGASFPEFGYKDMIPLFRGEKFDANKWLNLFEKAGAKYIIPVGEHHDGFAMWDSDLTTWDAKEKGPERDIIGELAKATRKKGMKFAPSIHRERHTAYYAVEKNVGGGPMPAIAEEIKRMPEAESLYGPFEINDAFMQDFLARWEEICYKYKPDFYWLDDFPKTFSEKDRKFFMKYQRKLIADYLNRAEEWGKEVYFNNKGVNPNWPEGIGCREKDNLNVEDISFKWQNPATMGVSYGYREIEEKQQGWMKPIKELIHLLIETVAKNGNLLLNVGPRPDGTIPEPQKERLLAIGNWLKTNGESIYASRPWSVAGEGRIRYTTNNKRLYAILLEWPEDGNVLLKSLSKWNTGDIKVVKLLGGNELEWSLRNEGLFIELPSKQVGKYAFALEIECAKALKNMPSVKNEIKFEDLHRKHMTRVRELSLR